jgi:poly(A) polymerase
MIKKLIGRLLGKKASTDAPSKAVSGIPRGKRVEVAAADHGIDPTLLDERAVKVVATLKEAGFEAYIVGGAVRDLLVNRRPKDFDVATSATPEEVKALFRRAFIIGRRFRIVHVIHGRGRDHEVIEVSTFRAYLEAADADQVQGSEKTSKSELAGKSHVIDASGRVLRDNVWGPQVEDAARRDFTVNAMYYDPVTQVVVDYHGGLADIRKKVLRLIGDPPTRYREDPVRILRAMRFAAKLGFAIEAKSLAPIAASAALLENVPPSRMFDEMVKLMQTGHAMDSVATLQKHQLTHVFPMLDAVFGPKATLSDNQRKFIELALKDTDTRVAEDRAVAPSFMLACLLWHEVAGRWANARRSGGHPFPALADAIDTVFDARIGDISGRGKLATDMREIWMMQPRFERRVGSAPHGLVDQPRYRAGYDFLRLRSDVGDAEVELADWWEDFALGSNDEREALIAAAREQVAAKRGVKSGPVRVPGPGAKKKSADAVDAPRPARASPSDDPAGDGVDDDHDDHRQDGDPGTGSVGDDAPAKRRRRRRRKPRSGDDGGSAVGGTATGGQGGGTD